LTLQAAFILGRKNDRAYEMLWPGMPPTNQLRPVSGRGAGVHGFAFVEILWSPVIWSMWAFRWGWKMISGDDAKVAYPLFQTEDGGSIPTSPLQFRIDIILPEQAMAMNKKWHSHMPEYRTGYSVAQHCKICYGASFDGFLFAIAIWSHPNARNLPQHTWLELRRMAISDDAPKNTASRMIKIMIADIKKRFKEVSTLISYQDTSVHLGTIYKASGWELVSRSEGYDWEFHGKKQRKYKRPKAQSLAEKIRWQKQIGREPKKFVEEKQRQEFVPPTQQLLFT
jgi:hypothetical protein